MWPSRDQKRGGQRPVNVGPSPALTHVRAARSPCTCRYFWLGEVTLSGWTTGPGVGVHSHGAPACPRRPALAFDCCVKSTLLVPQIRHERERFVTRCEYPRRLRKFNETFAGFSSFLANASYPHTTPNRQRCWQVTLQEGHHAGVIPVCTPCLPSEGGETEEAI